MSSNSNLLRTCWVFLLVLAANAHHPLFDIRKYGAIGDGKTDSTKALQNAWADACLAEGKATIKIPIGNYLVGQVLFKGPCNGSVRIELDGNLLADTELDRFTDNWLNFQYIDGLTITGKGKLDGQGASAWPHNNCPKKWQCKLLPMTLSLSFVTNATIKGITSLNSKFFHINMFASKNIIIRWVTITAPGDSPNTDGIHMGQCSNVYIADSNIGTGDDCVSIGSGTNNVTVSNVKCGPGHGISIGSLGKDQDKGDVAGVTVKNCTITGTMTGVRIKTWQAKPNAGTLATMKVSNFIFDDIVMNNVSNPILIDQEYCPYANCIESEPSLVKISGVKFMNIRGTSASAEVIKLVCSSRHPCDSVELRNINLKYTGRNPALKEIANCKNARVAASNVNPVSCL